MKVGGKVLRKDATYRAARFQMTEFTNGGHTLAEGTFGFEDERFDSSELSLLLTDWGAPRDVSSDYSASEDVTSLYGMATLNLTPAVTALFGARFEHTRTDFTQPNPETESGPLTGGGGYDNILPSAHLTIRPDDRSNIRAAWWTGLVRPRYQELVPRRVVDEDERTITYGNPDLKPRTAHSFDLMVERFTSGLGVVGLGMFYKRFQAFHTTNGFQEIVNGLPFEARQTVMGDGTASYLGLELSFSQRLGFLRTAARDFSVFGNYNYTWSEGEVDGRKWSIFASNRTTRTGDGGRILTCLRTATLVAILTYVPSAAAQEPDRRFEEIRRFVVPEAHQAPAADDRHVFAIDNAVIAKYDKRSGERVGQWSQSDDAGIIIHLNSGIVLDGVLYAAPSNYPEIPMLSSIEMFDASTLDHVGSHSFGFYPGSATWIDREDGFWWVGFANYEGQGGAPGRPPA